MRNVTRRSCAVLAGVAASLVAAAPASGHAVVSPPVARSGTLQVFTLSVPTEREESRTTSIELTVPDGFAIDSFAPSPGWKRKVASSGSGESAVVSRVTWSGGRVPAEEDAVFQFNATPTDERSYTFGVRQTYEDGTVVDWTGAESSDTPAPEVEAQATVGGGSSSTLAIVALAAATLGIALGLAALLVRGGDRSLT